MNFKIFRTTLAIVNNNIEFFIFWRDILDLSNGCKNILSNTLTEKYISLNCHLIMCYMYAVLIWIIFIKMMQGEFHFSRCSNFVYSSYSSTNMNNKIVSKLVPSDFGNNLALLIELSIIWSLVNIFIVLPIKDISNRIFFKLFNNIY